MRICCNKSASFKVVESEMYLQTLPFEAIAQALESLYTRLDFLAGDFGPGDIDPDEYWASVAKSSA